MYASGRGWFLEVHKQFTDARGWCGGGISQKREQYRENSTQITQGVAGKLMWGWRDNQCLQFCGEEKCWSHYKIFFFHRVQAQLHCSQTRTLFLSVEEEEAAGGISLSLASLAVIWTVNNRGVLPGFSVPGESLNLVSFTKDGLKKWKILFNALHLEKKKKLIKSHCNADIVRGSLEQEFEQTILVSDQYERQSPKGHMWQTPCCTFVSVRHFRGGEDRRFEEFHIMWCALSKDAVTTGRLLWCF